MKYSLIGVFFLALTYSCSLLKTKKVVQFTRDSIAIEEQWLNEKAMLQQRKQDWYRTQKSDVNTMEILADDVFYWHPDSGIQSRRGNVKVKIKLEQSANQLFLKHRDTLLVKTNGRSVGEIVSTSGSVMAIAEGLEKQRDFPMYWKLLAFGVLLLFLLGVAIRVVSR